MAYLLDTHTFLWLVFDDPHLSARVAAVIRDQANEIVFSAVSAWEIAIKYRLGRDEVIRLERDPEEFVPQMRLAYGLMALPIEERHTLRVGSLPLLHGDPFNRLLVAQAQIEGLTILSRDPAITQYDIPVVW